MKCVCVNKKCSKKFDVDPDIVCPHCHEKQKISKSLTASLIFATAVGVGGYQFNNLISTHNRYPTVVEYSIIHRCLNDNQVILRDFYIDKFGKCVSALEKARDKFDYSSYKKNPQEFNKIFKKYFKHEG